MSDGTDEAPAEAFDAFFLAERDSLLGQAFVLTGDHGDAQDLVQEVMVRAWRKWPRVSRLESPAGWARLVLRNLAIGRWRRKRGHPHEARLDERLSWGSSPDVGHLDVAHAIRALPERQRTALILHDVVGLSVIQTASEMDAPEGSVRGWLSRGRRALGVALGLVDNVGEREGELRR